MPKAALTLFIALLGVAVLVPEADAQRRRRRAQPAEEAPPQSAAIAPALGDLRWGMEPREVHQHFRAQIEARYEEPLRTAPDAIQQDRLREQMNAEIRRLRESYVRFTGEHTGWDASFLRGEFTHDNQESMLSFRDDNSQNFFFFIRGRLWKWYKAFDSSVFDRQPFSAFAEAIQSRFGEGVHRHGPLVPGGRSHDWLEWQDRSTRLRAVDQTRFYGFYCLVFEEKATLGRLDELRTNAPERESEGHGIVDAVILPEAGHEGDDEHHNIVDQITGSNIAAEEGQDSSSSSSSSSSGSSRSRSRSSGSDDLDLSDL